MISKLLELPRFTKTMIFLLLDTALIPITLYMAFALRYGEVNPNPNIGASWILFPLMALFGGFLINFYGLPRIKLNAFENRALLQVGATAASLALMAIVLSYMLNLAAPRSVPLTFGALFFLASVIGRIGLLYLIVYLNERSTSRVPVVIYGAGSAGIQMAAALRQSAEARPVAFVDDNPTLHGLLVTGLPVHAPSKLGSLIARFDVRQVLIAMPSANKLRQNAVVAKLEELPVEVKVLPSYIDMMTRNYTGDGLKPVSSDALLGRDKVELNTPEIAKAYAGRVVMVTGAGGSIGSELCRQLMNCMPTRIVLFEQSELQLYTIDRELQALTKDSAITVVSRLGSVVDKARLRNVMQEQGVDIILHAAAYKHVPLVEDNELEGGRNNVLGTQIVAEAAEDLNIERMILVSTDKAVRPTNIMGATKRMAELVVQDLQTRSDATKYAMVRFGNVLGSSGSVLPLFQAQISAGGPVTVTHPEVTRFFMTIPEAARLVLLAGAYATGGDVFVLDMGKPQKIIDIAEQMITLSGRRVLDPVTGEGDIEIKITGLRPGEKLYEELLIDDESLVGTPHPKILRAQESRLSQLEVAAMIKELQNCLVERDTLRFRQMVAKRVEGYQPPKDQVATQ